MSKNINIAVIEDNLELKTSFLAFTKKTKRINCLLAVDSVEKFLKYYRTSFLLDVIIIDINLPGMSGIEGLGLIKRLSPDSDLLMWTSYQEDDLLFDALRSGANGYLIKNAAFEEIEEHLINIKDHGDAPLSPQIARRILHHFRPKKSLISLTKQAVALTPKETLVVEHVVDGKLHREIASLMGISVSGVRFHIRNIYEKLQIRSKAELISMYFNRLLP